MPRIVPLQLLKCLRVLLDTNGGILSSLEVRRIAGLMTKYSKKLVSKCVYVQILKSTKTELLGDFMTVGGWGLTCTWLNDAVRTMNWPLVQEILELLLLSPVDVNRLRINAAPIMVKGLCRDGGNEGVRILAKRLVEQWLKIVTENPAGTTATNTPATAGETPQTSKDSTTAELKDSNMESSSSSDSTDSGCGGGAATQNYRIVPAERKRSIVLTIKTVDKSSASTLASTDTVYNDDDSSLPPSEAGSESRGTEPNANLDCSDKSNLDDSYITDSKLGDDVDKKHKNARGEKSKRSDKDRDKDRKSSSSHRSSSSSHKSSSSSSKSSSKSSSSSSSSHRSSSSSSDKHRDKDKARSSSSSSKEKDRKDGSSSSSSSSSSKHKSSKSSSSSSSNSSSSSSNSSTSKDRSRDKDKEKSGSSTVAKKDEKDNKLMPPPTAASLSDKKSKEGEGADVQKPKSISIPNRKASISIEIRRDTEKTSTVKTYQSKFRSHGLTEEAPPPPSRKGLKKPTSSALPNTAAAAAAAPSTILPLPSSLKRPSPPPRETSTEKKPKIDMTHVSGHVERPGAAKLIAPKKIATLVETNLFSDALAASIEPKKVVKRKRLTSAMSPTEKDAPLAPLKFYQDTLDESKSEDKSDDSTKENDENRSGSPGKDTDGDDDDIPLKKVKEDIEQKVQKDKTAAEGADGGGESPEEDDTPPEPKKPGPGCGPDGPPGVLMLHRRKGPKKKLTWQPEDKLTQIRYFEVDRSERVNVTKQSFLEMKNMERYSERDALNISRRGFDDNMEPQMEWRPLIEVDNVPDHPNGNLSKQRVVQAEREATTLRALYFSPDMIPDSAAEAEIEPHFSHDIPIIPIDDLTGNPDALNDYSSLPWPEPKGYSAASGNDGGFNDGLNNVMPPGMNPNLLPNNPFQPFGKTGYMPNSPTMVPNAKPPMAMNMPPSGPPPIWQNQMPGGPPGMGIPPMNGPPAGMVDLNGPMPPNFQFGSPNGMFGAPPNFNSMNYPPMMMNGPGGMGPGPGPGPMPNGPMMNGPPMNNGPMGPMPNGLGPRNNNMNRKNNNAVGPGGNGGGGGGNWRSGGNNFQDNSGGNWRSAGSGSNRGGGVGGGGNINNNNNTGICKQFMRGHCHMGKACKYVHPQKKRL